MKYLKLLFVLLVTLLIAGCTSGSSSGTSGGSSSQFKGGSDFLTLELEADAPPSIVYDSALSPFDIIVKLENKGEWDIPQNSLRVVLEGFSSDNWGNVQSNLVITEEMEGYDVVYDIDGGFDYASFENIEYKEKLVQNTYEHNFIVKSCFPYGSKVTFTACVDKDAKRSSKEDNLKLCEGFSNRDYSVSSGPIGVTKVEQQVVNGKLRLIFSLVNNQFSNPEVDVFLPDTLDPVCKKKEGKSIQTENSVMVTLDDPTIGTFECNGGKRVVFTSAEATRVTCEADISDLPTQELPLALNVEYETLKAFRSSLTVERSE